MSQRTEAFVGVDIEWCLEHNGIVDVDQSQCDVGRMNKLDPMDCTLMELGYLMPMEDQP